MQNRKLINISQSVVGSKGVYSIEFHEDDEYTHVKRANRDGTESLFSIGSGGGAGSASYIQNLELTDNGLTLSSTGIGDAFNTTLNVSPLRLGLVTSGYLNGNSPATVYTGGLTPADNGRIGGDWVIDLDTSNIWYLANANTNVWVQAQPSGGTNYTAGTGIDISNGVISSTVVDTNTTYNYGAVGAGGNINFALSGSDGSNDAVTMQAGSNVILTDIGGNTFRIDSSNTNTTYDLVSSQSGSNVNINLQGSNTLVDTVSLIAGANVTLTDNGSNQITIDAAPGSGSAPENLILRIESGAVPVAGGNGIDILFASLGTAVKTNSLHINPSKLNFAGGGEIEAASNCVAKISLAAYIDSGNTNGQITFQIFEASGGPAVPIGSASFELSNQAVSEIPVTFTSYFDLIAGNLYFFTAYSTQNQMTIIPNSFIEFEIMK